MVVYLSSLCGCWHSESHRTVSKWEEVEARIIAWKRIGVGKTDPLWLIEKRLWNFPRKVLSQITARVTFITVAFYAWRNTKSLFFLSLLSSFPSLGSLASAHCEWTSVVLSYIFYGDASKTSIFSLQTHRVYYHSLRLVLRILQGVQASLGYSATQLFSIFQSSKESPLDGDLFLIVYYQRGALWKRHLGATNKYLIAKIQVMKTSWKSLNLTTPNFYELRNIAE